jgi:hypothetical protein
VNTEEAAHLLIAEGERLIAAGRAMLGEDVDAGDGPDSTRVRTAVKVRRLRPITRPPGESDELAATRARRILREKGFVPTQ